MELITRLGEETVIVDKPDGSIKTSEELLSETLLLVEKIREKFVLECENNEGI